MTEPNGDPVAHDSAADLARILASRPGQGRFGREAVGLDEVDSTNRIALEKASLGWAHGGVVLTDRQTAGRGRQGRTWTSAAGANILLSVVVRTEIDPETWGLLPLAVSIAVAQTADTAVGRDLATRIKWPNDVLLGEKKVGGILVESRITPSFGARSRSGGFAVAGIGLNVNQVQFPPDIRDSATSLRLANGRQVVRADVLVDLVDRLESILEGWQTAPEALRESYRARLRGVGELVTVRGLPGERTVTGTLLGIDPSGALLLEAKEGLRTFSAAEITLRNS